MFIRENPWAWSTPEADQVCFVCALFSLLRAELSEKTWPVLPDLFYLSWCSELASFIAWNKTSTKQRADKATSTQILKHVQTKLDGFSLQFLQQNINPRHSGNVNGTWRSLPPKLGAALSAAAPGAGLWHCMGPQAAPKMGFKLWDIKVKGSAPPSHGSCYTQVKIL